MFRPSETRDVSLSERRCEPGEEVREDRPETRLSARPSRRLISCSVPEPTKESSSSFTTSLGPGRGTDSVLGRPKLPSLVEHQTAVGLMKDVKLNEVLVEYLPD